MEWPIGGIIKYSKNGKDFELDINKSKRDENIEIREGKERKGSGTAYTLTVISNSKIQLERAFVTYNAMYGRKDKVYMNGYQSWTDSREYFTWERMKGITPLANFVMDKYKFDSYGDYGFKDYSGKRGVFHGFTYMYIKTDGGIKLLGSLNERTGYTVFETDCKNGKLFISKDCTGYEIEDSYKIFEIYMESGNEDKVFDNYFDAMGIKKPTCKPMTGWTSWYNYYQDINDKIIMDNLKGYYDNGYKIDIFQIDDGYQTGVGDWLSIDKSKFPNGMKLMADEIKSRGYKAGIWLAPFVTETNSIIYREKPDWILVDEKGEKIVAGNNWTRFFALDLYNEEVRAYLKNVFNTILNEWGYDMVKLDFLYAVCMQPQPSKTRGQIMCEAMDFLRECVGDKLILGCGVPLGPSFGKVDYCRIGCDIALDWDDKWFMKHLHRERVSTLNAIRNSIGRKHLDGRAFLNDPDVFLLRDDNISLNDIQKNTLCFINNMYGNLIFTSDRVDLYDEKKKELFTETMAIGNRKLLNTIWLSDKVIEVEFTEKAKKFKAVVNLSDKYYKYEDVSIEPYNTMIKEM